MPPRTKTFNVREAENGFVVSCGDYGNKDKVAKNLAQVIKLLKEEFKGEDAESDEDEGE